MTEIAYARVRSADAATGSAMVEIDGSEGTALPARLPASLPASGLTDGQRCLVCTTRSGERVVLAVF